LKVRIPSLFTFIIEKMAALMALIHFFISASLFAARNASAPSFEIFTENVCGLGDFATSETVEAGSKAISPLGVPFSAAFSSTKYTSFVPTSLKYRFWKLLLRPADSGVFQSEDCMAKNYQAKKEHAGVGVEVYPRKCSPMVRR